jgi:hypothetical protein
MDRKDNTESIKRRTLHLMIFSCKMLQIKIRVSLTFFFKIPLKNRNSLDRVTLPLLKDINNLPFVKRGKIARYTKKNGWQISHT